MSHKRIIGIIVLGCLFILVLPFLSSEHEIKNIKPNDREIIVPQIKNNNKAMQEITIEKLGAVTPATTPISVGGKSNLTAPAIEPVNNLNPANLKPNNPGKITDTNKHENWYVQIASLKQSDPIAIESLKSSLRKINVAIETENITVKNIRFIRIKTKILGNKITASKERDRINKNLAYDKIQAFIKQR